MAAEIKGPILPIPKIAMGHKGHFPTNMLNICTLAHHINNRWLSQTAHYYIYFSVHTSTLRVYPVSFVFKNFRFKLTLNYVLWRR